MFLVGLSLTMILISLGWFFSCSGNDFACQATKSFSVGLGLIGVASLAVSVLVIRKQ